MSTVTDVTTVRYSGDLRADALLKPMPDWNFLLPERTTLYYTFDLAVIDPATDPALTALNAAQRAAAIEILNHAASVCGISFAETPSGAAADLHFGVCDIAGASLTGLTSSRESWSFMPDGTLTAYSAEAFIYLDNVEFGSTNGNPTAGSSGYQVLLHEIGHALGLGHPFEAPMALPKAEDNTDNTVMSYNAVGPYKSTFQAYDLLALRWIYGEDGLRGDHGFNSTYGPSFETAVNLVTGTATADALSGTEGRDTLAGLEGNDTLTGLAGDDTLEGGSGIDVALYAGQRAAYGVLKTAGGWQVTDSGGRDGSDRLAGVERLQFLDAQLALDLDGNAGTVARILGAVFGQAEVANPVYVGIGLYYLDGGMSYENLMQLALDAHPRLGAGASHEAVVDVLFANVVGRSPTAEEAAPYVSMLNLGEPVARLGVMAADTDLNAVNIDLVGWAQVGLAYLPYTAG